MAAATSPVEHVLLKAPGYEPCVYDVRPGIMEVSIPDAAEVPRDVRGMVFRRGNRRDDMGLPVFERVGKAGA